MTSNTQTQSGIFRDTEIVIVQAMSPLCGRSILKATVHLGSGSVEIEGKPAYEDEILYVHAILAILRNRGLDV